MGVRHEEHLTYQQLPGVLPDRVFTAGQEREFLVAATLRVVAAEATRVEFEDGCVANFTASRVSFEKTRKLRFFQPHDYISVDYASQTGTMVSLRMGRVTERKLEPPNQEPLKLELAAFVQCVKKRGKPAVAGADGLRALELAMCINAAIAERLMLR